MLAQGDLLLAAAKECIAKEISQSKSVDLEKLTELIAAEDFVNN